MDEGETGWATELVAEAYVLHRQDQSIPLDENDPTVVRPQSAMLDHVAVSAASAPSTVQRADRNDMGNQRRRKSAPGHGVEGS